MNNDLTAERDMEVVANEHGFGSWSNFSFGIKTSQRKTKVKNYLIRSIWKESYKKYEVYHKYNISSK